MIVEICPTPPTYSRGVLATVNQAAQLGADVEFAEVKSARRLLERVTEIEADAAHLRAGGHLDPTIASRYAAGKATLDEVLQAAAVAADTTTAAALKILNRAVAQANTAVWRELAKAGDKFILALRPVLAPVVEEIAALAAAIPPDCVNEIAARSGRFGRKVTAQWAQLDVAIARSDQIHDVADRLRQDSIIPARAPLRRGLPLAAPRPAERTQRRWVA